MSPVLALRTERQEGSYLTGESSDAFNCQAELFFCLLMSIDLPNLSVWGDRSHSADRSAFTPWLRLRLRHSYTVCHFGSASGCAALSSGSRNTITMTAWPQATWTHDEEHSLDNLSAACIQDQALHMITRTSNLNHISPSPCSLSSRLDISVLVPLSISLV